MRKKLIATILIWAPGVLADPTAMPPRNVVGGKVGLAEWVKSQPQKLYSISDTIPANGGAELVAVIRESWSGDRQIDLHMFGCGRTCTLLASGYNLPAARNEPRPVRLSISKDGRQANASSTEGQPLLSTLVE
jgi:hypothetical protein